MCYDGGKVLDGVKGRLREGISEETSATTSYVQSKDSTVSRVEWR